MKHPFHRTVLFASLWISLWISPMVAGESPLIRKPNIIFVFIDDMGWGDFSSFGNQDAATPHIDALAEAGLSFENFYVNAPICSPSRVSVSTGMYPQRWRITSYLAFREENEKRNMASWLDPEAPMLARILKEHGYATGHFGKWHMGGQRDVTDAPEISDYGFDQSLTNFEGLGPKLLPVTLNPEGESWRLWKKATNLGGPVVWKPRSEITGGFVDAAIPFMETALREGKPFYINLWPDDVHSPFWPTVENWGDGSKRQLYLSVLEEMDSQLARLFSFVQENENLRTNTLIVICSDNGPERGAGSAGPFRGHKAQIYEGGIRSPLIVWGPGFISPDKNGFRNLTSIFSAMDLVPSLLHLCGVAFADIPFDGEVLTDTLLGKSENSRKAPLYFSSPVFLKKDGTLIPPKLAVREDKWKLICKKDGSEPELYDLEADPGESTNLARIYKDLTVKLTRQCLEWFTAMP